NVNTGGFKLGAASLTAPTLSVAGHTTVAAAVSGCQSCHETAPYLGMMASTATTAGDSRPTALDKAHPTSGDCGASCHTTTPIFATNQTAGAKPSNHIPTSAPCAQCHTTAGNYTLYSVTGTHQGVTACLSCHGPTVNTTFGNAAHPTNPSDPIPFSSLDSNDSRCHTTTPTFATDMTQAAKPANHIPTAAPCTQCHTTTGSYALYSSAGTHQGVMACLSCHGPTVAGTFSIAANPVFSIVTTPGNHIPSATLDSTDPDRHSVTHVNTGSGGVTL